MREREALTLIPGERDVVAGRRGGKERVCIGIGRGIGRIHISKRTHLSRHGDRWVIAMGDINGAHLVSLIKIK